MMEKYTNEFGKECYKGITPESPFSRDLFHHPEWQPGELGEESLAFHCELGSLTVLVRKTGFIGEPLDVESGFRDSSGRFWLASGGVDLRYSECDTVGDAIEFVKRRANTCVGL